MLIVYIGILFLAFIGILTAFYIYIKRHSHHSILCPAQSACRKIVNSKFSVLFGISIELLGIMYFSFIATIFGLIIAFPQAYTPLLAFILLMILTIGGIFSLYLFIVESVIIKKWCRWCLIAMISSIVIWILFIIGLPLPLFALLQTYAPVLIMIHVIGATIGVGGATVTDVLFFKFLKDLRISYMESDILDTLSFLVWTALGILILSGFALYLPNMQALNQSPKFLVKAVIVGIIFMNGLVLNMYVSPHLQKISFGKRHHHKKGELHFLRKVAFATGVISIISWYSTLILGMLSRQQPLSFTQLFGIYLLCIFGGILVSLFLEKRLGTMTRL